MRKLTMIALVLVLGAGCKKAGTKAGSGTPRSEGGVVSSIHRKVKESVSQQQMDQLWKYIEAISIGNTLPSEQQIKAEIQKDGGPQLWKLIQSGDVVLTGTKSRTGIWAYTKEPQTAGGEHWVITQSGVKPMTKEALETKKR